MTYLGGDWIIKNIQVLFVAAHLGGGAGKAISGIALQSSREFDVKVALLEAPKESKYIRLLQENGIPLSVLPDEQDIVKAVCNSDIIILNWWNHPLTIRFLLSIRQIRCRIIIWSHINGCYYPLLPADFLNLFSHIIFTSPASLENKQWSCADRKQIKSKSSIVYGMGDFRPWQIPRKTDYSIKGRSFVSGYVGTISYEKINRYFIDFCTAAVRAIPEIEYRMVGLPAEKFLNEVMLNHLENSFSFKGYLESPEEAYLSFDVFGYLLQPRSYATTENVLLEAMAYGLPIIVLNNLVERYIIQDGVNGFLVSSQEEYVAKMLELYQNEDLRRQIGSLAREYVIEKYNPEVNFRCFYQAVFSAIKYPREKINIDPLFQNGFEAFCYFSGMDHAELEEDIKNVRFSEEKYYLTGMGKSKAGIAQYCEYFNEKKLIQLLKAVERRKKSSGMS